MNSERASRLALAALIIGHVVLGLIFNTSTPIFEAPDEDGHYLFVRYLQIYHSLPVQNLDTKGPRAHHPPLFHVMAALLSAWVPNTGDAHRIVMQVNPHVWFRYDDPALDNKAQWVHYGPSERFPYSGQALVVHLMRLLALAFSVVGVLFTYLLGRQLRPGSDGRLLGLLAAGLVAFNPMVLFMSGVGQNNTTMLAAGAVILYALCVGIRGGFRLRNWIVIGVLLAIGLLLQLSSLVMAAPIGLTLLYEAWRRRRVLTVVTGGLAVAVPFLALTGWWFWRNYVLYGDFTADKIVQKMWCCDPIPARLALNLFFTGLLGRFGNGLMITYPYPVYWLAAVIGLFALAGAIWLGLRTWRGLGAGPWRQAARLEWLTPEAALWALHTLTIVGVFGALLFYAATVAPGLPGRYTFPAFPSIACVLAAGWLAWFRPRWRWPAALGLVGLNLAATLFGLYGLLIPTYRMPPSPSAAELKAMTPLNANIGDTAQVLGYKLSSATVRPGDTLEVTLYVQPLSQTDVPYTVFVHLLEPDTGSVTQRDSYPGLGNYATTIWDVGRTFVDVYELKLPPDAAPATAQIVYGLYNASTGARLPVTGPDAGPAQDSWVQVATVQVKP
jgi:4-amino-4-deoxy-L-arabinose transferase-like glycosyltransferase